MFAKTTSGYLPGATAPNDPSRDEERSLEILRSIAETERRTILANIGGLAIIAAVSQLLPNAADFHWPIVFRLLATAYMTTVYTVMRQRIAKGLPARMPPLAAIALGLFGGITWAMLLAPVFVSPVLHPAAFFVCAGVMISVSLVASHTAPLPYVWVPFGASFLVAFWLLMLEAPDPFGWWMSAGVTVLYISVALFSISTGRQRIAAAEMLIDNHRLGEELTEALAQAEFLANRDPLTGLYNRRVVFESNLPGHFEGASSHVLLIDIDHFKQVNDRFGHTAGDRMLVRVGETLRDLLREIPGEGHFAARIGGEEFAIFLALADRGEAIAIAGKARAGIAAIAREMALPDGLGTASVGVSAREDGEPIGTALQRADRALYEAKRGGRDRVVSDRE